LFVGADLEASATIAAAADTGVQFCTSVRCYYLRGLRLSNGSTQAAGAISHFIS